MTDSYKHFDNKTYSFTKCIFTKICIRFFTLTGPVEMITGLVHFKANLSTGTILKKTKVEPWFGNFKAS